MSILELVDLEPDGPSEMAEFGQSIEFKISGFSTFRVVYGDSVLFMQI